MELFAKGSPMARLKGCQLKIIDFNHSKMFNPDDSPVRVRMARAFFKETELTEEQKWKKLSEIPSPGLPVYSSNGSRDSRQTPFKVLAASSDAE